MEKIKSGTYVGERALYHINNKEIDNCIFEDGESPLKECHSLVVKNCEFRWKYPLWYSKDVECNNIKILETARSGIWYTENLVIRDSELDGPKYFRRCKNIAIHNCHIMHAQETFWETDGILLRNVKAKGDYLCMNSSNIDVDGLYLEGNYAFDGAKNVVIKNSILHSKDSFWNTENVTCINCKIIGEYLGWNSKNLTFIDCELESNQGLCYIEKLVLKNTSLNYTDLCFELCKDIDAEVTSYVISIKNPISGKIKVKSVGQIILDKDMIDPSNTIIEIEDE